MGTDVSDRHTASLFRAECGLLPFWPNILTSLLNGRLEDPYHLQEGNSLTKKSADGGTPANTRQQWSVYGTLPARAPSVSRQRDPCPCQTAAVTIKLYRSAQNDTRHSPHQKWWLRGRMCDSLTPRCNGRVDTATGRHKPAVGQSVPLTALTKHSNTLITSQMRFPWLLTWPYGTLANYNRQPGRWMPVFRRSTLPPSSGKMRASFCQLPNKQTVLQVSRRLSKYRSALF